jgi:glycopeptide antibiotics resistance protein
MLATNWVPNFAGAFGRPSSPFAGLIGPALRDLAIALLLVVAGIGVARVVRRRRTLTRSVIVGLAMWLAAIAYLTLQPGHAGRLNLVPFAFGSSATPFEPVANVLLFVPLGILLSSLGWRLIAVLGLGLGISLAIEVTQFLLGQGCTADVNDLIENMLGAGVGWLVALALGRISATYRKPHIT